MTEQQLFQRAKKALQPGHIIRVENPLDPGMPDVNYCIEGVEGWLELKMAISCPKTKELRDCTLRVSIRPVQPIWWQERLKVGGRVHILVETPGWPSDYLLLPPKFVGIRPFWQYLDQYRLDNLSELRDRLLNRVPSSLTE